MAPQTRSLVEVDLSHIEANALSLSRALLPGQLWAVVKGEGYGLGLVPVARRAVRGGAFGLIVADSAEVRRLRAAGIAAPVLVLNFPDLETLASLSKTATEFTIGNRDQLDVAASLGAERPIRIHLEIDTGMGRGGILPEDVPRFLTGAVRVSGIVLASIWSHLARAGDPIASAQQLALFLAVTQGLYPDVPRHLIATQGLSLGPSFRLNGARIGLGLAGLAPRSFRAAHGLRLAVRWTSFLSNAFERPAGATVGYGGMVLSRSSKLGLVPVGFSDGYPRLLHGRVGVGNRLAPVLGPVSMNSILIDLTDLPSSLIGDEVRLLAEEGPDLDELLAHSFPDVLPNSFVCGRTRSVPIRYGAIDCGGGPR